MQRRRRNHRRQAERQCDPWPNPVSVFATGDARVARQQLRTDTDDENRSLQRQRGREENRIREQQDYIVGRTLEPECHGAARFLSYPPRRQPCQVENDRHTHEHRKEVVTCDITEERAADEPETNCNGPEPGQREHESRYAAGNKTRQGTGAEHRRHRSVQRVHSEERAQKGQHVIRVRDPDIQRRVHD